MNFGALIGEYASARAEVARAMVSGDEDEIATTVAHHNVLQTELERRLGVFASYFAATPPPAEVAEAWNGRPAS